jgi:deoxyadenosine/deoxycytidine kinase
LPPLKSPPHQQYQKSKLTKQQQTQQQCQLQEDVNSLAKKHVKLKRMGRTKFNSYKKYYDEEQQELLLQQQQVYLILALRSKQLLLTLQRWQRVIQSHLLD